MTNEFNVFEPVSGHHEHIWRGPTFSVNNNCSNDIHASINNSNEYCVRTVWKQTTAWEALWYIFFTIARLWESKELEECKDSFTLHESCIKLIDAVRGLLPFVATLFQLELPQSLLSEVVVKSCIATSKSVTIQDRRKRQEVESEAASLSSLLESTTIIFDVSKFCTQSCTKKDSMDIINTLCMVCNELWCFANQITEYNSLFDEKHCVICINDITSLFTFPSVMDIKLGKIRYGLTTPSEKIARIRAKEAKYTNCTSTNNNNDNCISLLGLRICGARYVHRCVKTNYNDHEEEKNMDHNDCNKADNNTNTKWLYYTKEDGYAVSSVNDVQQLINAFCAGIQFPTDSVEKPEHEEKEMTLNIKTRVHAAVQALLDFFTSTTGKGKELLEHMTFVSSSLLVVYDTCTSDVANSINVNSGDSIDVNVKVLLIDFARCSLRRLNYSVEEVGFVHGLQMFSSLLALPAS